MRRTTQNVDAFVADAKNVVFANGIAIGVHADIHELIHSIPCCLRSASWAVTFVDALWCALFHDASMRFWVDKCHNGADGAQPDLAIEVLLGNHRGPADLSPAGKEMDRHLRPGPTDVVLQRVRSFSRCSLLDMSPNTAKGRCET